MKLTANVKRVLSALLVFVLVFSLIPMDAHAAAADVVDAAIIFSDLHTSKSNYKQSELTSVMTAIKNTGLPVSSVTSAGDAFSVNEDSSSSNGPYTGKTSTLTGYIQSVLGNVPVNYVWSDHDRYAVKADGSTLPDKKSQLIYGAGNDGVYGTSDDDNYYVYSLSMGDLCSYDRYKAGFNYTEKDNKRASKGYTATVPEAIAGFKAAVANLDKSKPLLITSHQPLFDNRNDNAWAGDWFDAINEVAEEMDVAFFYGHNHKYDTGSDYYYAKGSTMPVATRTLSNGSSWNYKYETGSGYKPSIDLKAEKRVLNFTHMCAGYLEPTSTGSYSTSTTRLGTLIAVAIYEDSIQYTTYNKSGIYTGKYAVNVNVKRDHANQHTHTFETVTVEATCTTDGSVTVTCTGCGQQTVEVLPALGHTYTRVETAATCVKDGSKVNTCVCGDTYTADQVAALGHNYSVKVTAPTCETEGHTTYTCSCGKTYTADKIAALGHSYTTQESGDYLIYTCTCGHSYSEKVVMNYTYIKTSALDENSYVITVTAGKKTYALSHKDNAITTVEITVSGDVTTSQVDQELVWNFVDGVLSYEDEGVTYYLNVKKGTAINDKAKAGEPKAKPGKADAAILELSTTTSAQVRLDNKKLKIGSYYLHRGPEGLKLDNKGTDTVLYVQTAE